MARVVESQQTWIESVIYAIENLSHDEANRRLGGTTALLKAHCSMVLEIVAREAVQILGGIAHTRGTSPFASWRGRELMKEQADRVRGSRGFAGMSRGLRFPE